MDVVEIDDTIGRYAVVISGQFEFGDKPSHGTGQRRDDHRTNALGDGVAGQNKDRSIAARR